MKKNTYVIGALYNNAKLIKELPRKQKPSGQSFRMFLFKCKCGVEFSTTMFSVKRGTIATCGCGRAENATKLFTKNGNSKKEKRVLYSAWKNIISRVSNNNNAGYKDYGGRGITICDEWRNDFMVFYIWAIANGWEQGLSIDRRDNNGNYEPPNCRWVNMSVQSINKRKQARNTSGFKGVCFEKQVGKWRARVNHNKTTKHIGLFNTALEAAKAYDSYVIKNGLEHTVNGV